MNESNKEEKKFCNDCGYEYPISQLRKRKDGKHFCVRCESRNQLP